MRLTGTWDLKVIPEALVIIPSEKIVLTGHQECRSDGQGAPQVQTRLTRTVTSEGNFDLEVNYSVPSSIPRPRATQDAGLLSLYMPKSIWDRVCEAMKFKKTDKRNSGKYRYSFEFDFACQQLVLDTP